MGHVRLGVLPRTRKWREVVELLDAGAADERVIAASARAAERDLLRAARDPVFVEAVRLLLVIPLAARSDSFAASLGAEGLRVPDEPSLLGLVTAVGERLDGIGRTSRQRTDLGELAGRALLGTLSTMVADELPSLFSATPDDVRMMARKLSWDRGISAFSREFFGRLTSEVLSYWLDRTLALHVGREQRFGNIIDRSAFDAALTQYSAEATRIIREFASGWYGKRIHEAGRFTSEDAAAFGAVCLKKIVAELRLKSTADA